MNTMNRMGAILALAALAAGCSDFLNGPGLTENPNSPTVATAVQQLVAMQANMATRLEGQVARCAGIFTQQLIGSNNQQLSYCTQYAVTEADISGQMSGFYTGGGLLGMRNVQKFATETGDNFMLGEAKIWEGLAMGTATSVWGDLPYSEAVGTSAEPTLDSQQSIYAAVQTRLDEGIAAMQASAAGASGNCAPGDGDLIYCATAVARATQITRWIKAAYTIKARFYLHLVEQNGPSEYLNAITAANQGIDEAPTSATQAINGQAAGDFRFYHGSVQDFDANIWAEFLQQRQDIVAGNVLIQILKARNDTVRLRSYFDINSAGQFVGNDQNNNPVAAGGSIVPSVINTSVRRAFTFRQPEVTWAENQLILAEAKFKTGDPTFAANVNAVRVAVGLTALAAPTFVDIMTEKYIAMFQNIDVWSDYKRTCIPTLVPFGSPARAEVLGRLPYGSGERAANPHIPLPSAYPTGTSGPNAVRNWNDPTPC